MQRTWTFWLFGDEPLIQIICQFDGRSLSSHEDQSFMLWDSSKHPTSHAHPLTSSIFLRKVCIFQAQSWGTKRLASLPSIVYSSIMASLSYWTWHAQIPEEFWNGGKENKCQGYSLAHLTLLPPFFLILSISRKLCLFTKNKSCPVNSGKIRIIFYFNSIYHLLMNKKNRKGSSKPFTWHKWR